MSAPGMWEISGADRELFHRELDSFLPHRIFDAHAHFYRRRDFRGVVPALVLEGPEQVGLAEFLDWSRRMTPGREYSALAFAFPAAQVDFEAANEFAASQTRSGAASRAAMLVSPEMDVDFVRAAVRGGKFSGLKCYHVYSAAKYRATYPRSTCEWRMKSA
jgi:glutamate-1-semialdehyde 2,1-aminomutase